MTWALAGQILVCWIILSFVLSPLIGKWLANRRTRSELEFLLERERRIRRLSRKLQIADAYTALRTEAEQEIAFMLDTPDEAA